MAVAFNPNGTILANGFNNNTIKLWNVETKSEILIFQGHNGSIMSVAFNNNGSILASGSEDNSIKLWSIETSTEITTLQGHHK